MHRRWDRRQFLQRSAATAVVVTAGGRLLTACGGDDAGGTADTLPVGRPDQPVTLPIYDDNPAIADGLEPESGPLRVLNYPDYVNPETLAAFTDQFGADVEVTTFDTDAEAVEKLRTGSVDVDVFLSAAYNTLPKLVVGKIVQPLNRSYLTNFGSILPAFQDPFYDQGSQYSVPYTVFGTGIMYRTDQVEPGFVEEKGWDVFWDPTYKGRMSILDDYREGLALAMLRQGLTDLNTTDPAVIAQAGADLEELTGTSNIKINIEGYKDVPEGTTLIAHAWSGDPIAGVASYLPEGTDPSVVGWWYPADRRSVVNNDMMLVVKGAERPVLAHAFVNFLLDPANARQNFAWNGYQPPIVGLEAESLLADELIPAGLAGALLTTDDVAGGYRFLALDPSVDKLYTDAWSSFTAGT